MTAPRRFDTSIEPATFARSCREWGFDTAILHPGFLRDDRMASAPDKEGIALWLNLPVFFNQEYLEQRPEEYSITSRGRRAARDWLRFACPSRETYRDSLLRGLKGCLSRVQPKVVSLDFIRPPQAAATSDNDQSGTATSRRPVH